jgi:hypothetical protein
LEDVIPPKLYKARDNSTFKDRISGLVGRLHIRLSQYAARATKKLGKSRLSSSRSDFNKKLSEEKVRIDSCGGAERGGRAERGERW